MENFLNFWNFSFNIGQNIHISVKKIIVFLIILLVISQVLKITRKFLTKTLPESGQMKLKPVFNYVKWILFIILFLGALSTAGVNLTTIFAASAALLIGVGLALQTLFQDVISGVFILIDQTVHVGDIIELDGKVGRVEEINLRTTRAVTIDNRVVIIPNHLYLTTSLYNWTQNGVHTRESIDIGVAYGSDVELVEKILIEAALSHPDIPNYPPPSVRFMDFGDSALQFKLVFSMTNSFEAVTPKSDLRFMLVKKFNEHNIKIPFPQREVHIVKD